VRHYQYAVIEGASDVTKGTVEISRLDDSDGIMVKVTSPDGDVLETLDFDEGLDWVCGPGKNRIVDTISGRRAVVVGAVDHHHDRLMCRVCVVRFTNGSGSRFTHLSPKELKVEVMRRGQTHCQCGRDLT
jgi:hypothetical protein